MSPVLTDADREHFLEHGFVVVKGCFDHAAAEPYTSQIFPRLGFKVEDTNTWTAARTHMPGRNHFSMESFAPKAWQAICEVIGDDTQIKRPFMLSDAFIVNLRERVEQPWQPPSADCPGWHKDGDFFRHFLDSPEQGLLIFILWSDVLHKGGATYIACDSIKHVAELLLEHPEGILPNQLGIKNLIRKCSDFREVTGSLGDVVLLHPYMLHAASQNLLGIPRVITNPPLALLQPMRFDRDAPERHSLVEQAVLKALGKKKLNFVSTGQRERIVPQRVLDQQKAKAEEDARLAGLAR